MRSTCRWVILRRRQSEVLERGAPGGRTPLEMPGHWCQSAVAVLGADVVQHAIPKYSKLKYQRHGQLRLHQCCFIRTSAQVRGLGDGPRAGFGCWRSGDELVRH